MIKMTIYTLHSKAFSKVLMYTVDKKEKKNHTVILNTKRVIKQLNNQTRLHYSRWGQLFSVFTKDFNLNSINMKIQGETK